MICVKEYSGGLSYILYGVMGYEDNEKVGECYVG